MILRTAVTDVCHPGGMIKANLFFVSDFSCLGRWAEPAANCSVNLGLTTRWTTCLSIQWSGRKVLPFRPQSTLFLSSWTSKDCRWHHGHWITGAVDVRLGLIHFLTLWNERLLTVVPSSLFGRLQTRCGWEREYILNGEIDYFRYIYGRRGAYM